MQEEKDDKDDKNKDDKNKADIQVTTLRLHFIYVSLILVILLIGVVALMSNEAVSRAAFDNVSFASTIVSIVLAVISMFVSMNASTKTGQNIGNMLEIEGEIRKSTNRLQILEESLKKTQNDVNNLRDNHLAATDNEVKEHTDSNVKAWNQAQKGNSTNQVSDKKNPVVAAMPRFTPDIVEKVTRKVLAKVDSDFHLTNLTQNAKIKGLNGSLFDAVATYRGREVIIDIKLYHHTNIEHLILESKRNIKRVQEATMTPTRCILVLLIADNEDINKVEKAVSHLIDSTGARIIPAIYPLREFLQDNQD